MPNTYSWSFPALDCYPTHAGQSDVVFTVHWRREATDGTHVASLYGTVAVAYEADQPFVPFAELSPELVTGWVEAALGPGAVAAHEAALDAQIAAFINPPVVTMSPPWAGAAPAPAQ